MDANEQNLTRYLLGEMAEPERSALEERYFADPQLFEQIVDAENKLVDGYARGELSGDLRARFERSYLADPARGERVKFAAALATKIEGDVAATPQTQLRTSTSLWWLNLRVALRGLTPTFRYAAGFATLLVVLFGAWLLISAWRRQREAAQVQANAAPQEREPAERAEKEQKRTPEVAGGQNGNQPQPPPAPQPTVTPTPEPEIGPRSVTLALTFGGVRGGGGGETPTLALSAATTQVLLVLSLNDNEYPNYRASLQNASGTTVFSQSNVKPNGTRFVFNVPAQKLHPGEYVLKLSGVNPNGEVDPLSKSLFRIVRK